VDWPECEIMLVQPYRSTCDVQVWSTGTVVDGEVKVMRARADEPGAVKGECWVLTDGSEQLGYQPRWLTPGTRTCAMTWWSGPCCPRGRGLTGHASDRGGHARGKVGLKTTQHYG
jgi:hypothetical protein